MSSPVKNSQDLAVLARLLPEEFSFLLTDRPTLPFEKSADYDKLLGTLIVQYDPRTIIDALQVKELADCQWEIFRYRRMKKAAVTVEMQEAAWALMEKTLGHAAAELKLGKDKENLDELVRWATIGPTWREKLEELQEYAGVSDDMLLYKTFAMSHGTLAALEGALSRVERRRDQLVRMLEDRSRLGAGKNGLLQSPSGTR